MKTNTLVIGFVCSLMSVVTVKGQSQNLGAGSFHSLALCTADSEVRSWGANSNGQLGTGDTIESNLPTVVHGPGNVGALKEIISVIARENFSLALKHDGTLWAWGFGADGEMGNNSNMDQWSPVQVHGAGNVGFLSNVKAVEGGYAHVLALKSDSTVWAWGDNTNGELGDNTTNNDSTPVQVHGPGNVGFLTGIVAIAAGQQFSLALRKDGTLWAWGLNAAGELADNTLTERHTPVQVHGANNVGFLTNVTKIAAGGGHALAIRSDSTAWSWGFNVNGELGNNTTSYDTLPAQVHGPGNVGYLTGVTDIKAGDYFSAAISKSSNVWIWGYNYYGQLGTDDTSSFGSYTPIEVHGLNNVGFLGSVTSISLGDEHALAFKNDGSLWSWGWNGNGQLGNDSTVDRWTPINIQNPCNVFLAIEPVIADNASLELYPNPANKSIIVINSGHNATALEIYNMLGEKVYQSKLSGADASITVDVSSQVNGVYLVRLLTAQGIISKKYIVQR